MIVCLLLNRWNEPTRGPRLDHVTSVINNRQAGIWFRVGQAAMDTVRDIDLGIDGIGMRVIHPLSLQEPGEVPGSHVQAEEQSPRMRTQVPRDTEPEGRCAHDQHQTPPRETETNVPRECDETRYIHRQQHGFKEKWRSQWQVR